MKNLKHILLTLGLATVFGLNALGQVVWTEPAEIDPEAEIKIFVDINMVSTDWDIQSDPGPFYIWTWKPAEHPTGHPLENGTGTQAWKNSNEALKMTDEGNGVWSYTMTPTQFYEVDAQTVYAEDIHFLVKPKDGGGFGDPDIKSEDLMIVVDPPVVAATIINGFPGVFEVDDIFSVVYDNSLETKETMMNLSDDEVYIYAAAVVDSTTEYAITPFFGVGTNPDLQMTSRGDGTFIYTIVPETYFADVIPMGSTITSLKFVVRKKDYAGTADRNDEDPEYTVGCQ